MSLPIAEAMRENSPLLPGFPFVWSNLCFASEPREGREDLFRIDSTQARNSVVRSWIGMWLCGKVERIDAEIYELF